MGDTCTPLAEGSCVGGDEFLVKWSCDEVPASVSVGVGWVSYMEGGRGTRLSTKM